MNDEEIAAEVAQMNFFHIHLLLRAYIAGEWGRPTAIITPHGKELAAWILHQSVYRETVDGIIAEFKKGDRIQ